MSQEENKKEDKIYDVIIIGAGYSGLSAALYFKDCNIKNFVVLEARNRVGGRVVNEEVKLDDGTKTYRDAGGAYVAPKQNRILRLCKRFGIKPFHVHMKGKTVMEYNQKVSHYQGVIPTNLGIFTLLDINYSLNETDKLSQLINTSDIQKSKLSKELLHKYDNMTVQQWIDSTMTNKVAKESYKSLFSALALAEPSEVSMLSWLYDLKSSISVFDVFDGAQDYKIVGGAFNLCDSIQKEINLDKKRIYLQHNVKLIEQNEDYVTIHCDNNTNSASFKTKYVLCTIPPCLYQKIEWKPDLCWQRLNIARSLQMGYIIRTNAYFKTAFWRDEGFCGASFCFGDKNDNKDNPSPVVGTIDDCNPDGSYPSLMGVISGDKAIKYMNMSYDERKHCVLQQYYRLFKNDKAITQCIGYVEKTWHNDEFSGGCYPAGTVCNVMSKSYWSVLKKPENNKIFFAGTALSDQWNGYMDGAIQSGEREANKITNGLAKNDKNIKIKKIYDFDKEPDSKMLPYVSEERSWIEQNMPSAKQAKYALLLVMSAAVGICVFYMLRKAEVVLI